MNCFESKIFGAAILAMAAFLLSGCSSSTPSSSAIDLRAQFCEPIEGAEPEHTYDGAATSTRLDFAEIRDAFNSACMSCHQAPANSGNFTYIDSIASELRTIGGITKTYPGFAEIAEKSVESIFTTDENASCRETKQKSGGLPGVGPAPPSLDRRRKTAGEF